MPPARPSRLRRFATSALWLALASTLTAEDQAVSSDPASLDRTAPTAPFELGRFVTPGGSYYYFNLPPPAAAPLVFLPPDPLPLDTPVPLRSPLDTGVAPPAELAAHVHDLFYPQLASRLAEDNLPRRQRLKLDDYRALKLALLEELHSALAASAGVEASARHAALAACAVRQASRLQELEATAEQLRTELGRLRDEWLSASPPARPSAPAPGRDTDFTLLRIAAYQADGLSLEQRRLLLSLAVEGEMRPSPAAPGTLFFFSPEGASLRLPATVSPQLAGRIAAYTTARRALGDELLAVLGQASFSDPAGLRQLAGRQAPGFAALETLAASLREDLRNTPGVDGVPPAPAAPPALAARLNAYRDRKQALLRQLNTTLNQTVRAAGAATPAGLAVPVSAFTADQQAEIAVLNREKNELRLALAEHHRANAAVQDRKSVDNLLEEFERARFAQELQEKYRDYRAALLEPGLSPAQRRLLLDAALQALAIPLPSGESIHRP